MYRQQFYIIANIFMVLDAIILIATGYLAYSISLEVRNSGLVMGWYDFLGSVLFLMFANNYFMGRFGFYSSRRFASTWSMITTLLLSVSLSFGVLSTGVILIGIHPFSRVYLLVHFLSALIALIVTRFILYHYLVSILEG